MTQRHDDDDDGDNAGHDRDSAAPAAPATRGASSPAGRVLRLVPRVQPAVELDEPGDAVVLEVTVSWGDAVLHVAHLAPGDALPADVGLAGPCAAGRERGALVLPADARGWLESSSGVARPLAFLRNEGRLRALAPATVEGCELVLAPGERLVFNREALTVRARLVPRPRAVARERRVHGARALGRAMMLAAVAVFGLLLVAVREAAQTNADDRAALAARDEAARDATLRRLVARFEARRSEARARATPEERAREAADEQAAARRRAANARGIIVADCLCGLVLPTAAQIAERAQLWHDVGLGAPELDLLAGRSFGGVDFYAPLGDLAGAEVGAATGLGAGGWTAPARAVGRRRERCTAGRRAALSAGGDAECVRRNAGAARSARRVVAPNP